MASDKENPGLFARTLPWLGLLIVAGLIYDGFVFYSRWSGEKAIERAHAAKEAERYRQAAQRMGSDELKVVDFYAAPAHIRKGASTSLCYGVRGADEVQLEPPVAKVWPAVQRCFQVSPGKDTEYQLTAADKSGHKVSGTLTVKVLP